MRNAWVWVTLVAAASVGCESTPPPQPPPPPPPVATVEAPPVATVEAPRPPEKKLLTITTKSPEARAALLAGWDLEHQFRADEAVEQYRKALAADPDFALAHTFLGAATSGAAGQTELDAGLRLAAQLPEAERLVAEGFAAWRRQETEKFYADIRRVSELAPDDYQAFYWLGWNLVDLRDFAGAEAAFKRLLELNPEAGFAHGSLSFIYQQQRRYDDALAAARKYVESAPAQPGAHQLLGQALLNVNQAKDAEAELTKAVAAGAKTRWAYYDLAEVKAILGDYAGARDVLERSKAAEVQPTDALERAQRVIWALFAEGKQAEALKLLDATEKDADEHKLPWPANMAILRARALWTLGRQAESIKAADAGLTRCDRPESSVIYKGNCVRELLMVKASAQVHAGKIAEAQKTVARLRDEAKKWPDNAWLQTSVGMLNDQVEALAKKDKKAAAAVLAKCPPDDFFWKLSVLRQLERDGDKAGADQVRKELLGRPIKDMAYPLVARVAAKSK